MDVMTQIVPPMAITAPTKCNFPDNIKTIGSAKIEVSKIPVKKKPISTAGPDFWDEKRPSSAQLAAIIIGSGENNMNGTVFRDFNGIK